MDRTPQSSRGKSKAPNTTPSPVRPSGSSQQPGNNPFGVPMMQSFPLFSPPQFHYQSMYQQPFPFSQPENFPTQVDVGHYRYTESEPETFVPETQPDPIPETQPDSPPERQPEGSRPRKRFANRAAPTIWTPKEEETLAKAWLEISEDEITANSQKRGDFWKRVTAYFHRAMGSTARTQHMINSKWIDMNGKMHAFNQIYQTVKAQYQSGRNDLDIMETARERYRQDKNNATFNNEAAWRVVKDSPRWYQVPRMEEGRQSKKSKTSSSTPVQTTSSDARCGIDLNEHIDVDEDEPRRPTGRDKAKRAASGGTSEKSEEVSDILQAIKGLQTQRDDELELKREKMALEKEKMEIKKMKELRKKQEKEDRDFSFYITDHSHLPPAQLAAIEEKKRRIKAAYNWNF